MLWSACGAMLMAGAANLLTIFLGLELLSLGLYCLCGMADRKTVARVGAEISHPLVDGVAASCSSAWRCCSARPAA